MQPPVNTQTLPTEDMQAKIYASIMLAHILNADTPGTFEKELNKLFKKNNLPEVKIPEDPPSEHIVNKWRKTTQTQEQATSGEQQIVTSETGARSREKDQTRTQQQQKATTI